MSSFDDLNLALDKFGDAVVAATHRKVQNAVQADDANSLGGMTASQIVAQNNALTQQHSNRVDNPHQVTPALLDAFTKAESIAMAGQYIPKGILPISRIGDLNGSFPVNVNSANSSINFANGIPAILAGISVVMPAATLVYSTTARNYVYLRLTGGIFSYQIQTTVQAESATNMLIGVFDARNNTNTLQPVTRIDTYRISTVSAGSAIPVSVGFPSDPANLAWS
jgi:hypothetical protein